MEKLSKKVSSRNGNVNAFSAAGTYDDVFGGPPKYSTLSPRIEDYSEIFGGFRGSSIPVLEVPEADVDDADVFLDVTRSFDYSEVFRSLGGGDGDDLAFSSYHDLFVRLHSNGREYGFSDEAWTPAETESLSEDSVTSPHSAQSKSLSNGVSQQSLDNPRQFNLSFHRANPSEEDITTEVHVAQLHAVPGYTFLVDECAPFQRTMFEETHLPGTDNMNLCKHATNGIKRDKNLRKTESQPQDHSFAIHELENGDQREWEICYRDSHSNKAFVSISDISLRTHPSDLPPPSRPPPAFTVRNGYSGELPSNFRSRNHEFGWTSDDNAPPVYDVEIDAGSSSFASAAAMKETMEKAQSKLRSAKEIMERRKEGLGLPSRVKLGMKEVRVKEGNKSRPLDKFSDMNVDKVFVAPDIDERKIDAFVGEKRKEVKKPINITSNIMEGDKFIFVTEETSMKNESKETWSTEEPCSVYEAGEWKQETEFFELVKRDKPAQGNQEKVCVQNDEVQEHFLERRTNSEVFKRGEESCMRQNVAREAYVGDDQKKFNLAEETRGRVENKKKENVGQEVSWQIEREKKSRKLRKHKEIGQKLSAVDEWKEHDILIEVFEDEHYLDGFHQSGKRYKKISEKGEQEKRTNKSIDIAEDVTRLVHPHVKERSEKKTKASELVGREEASCEKKESQNYLKDVTEKKNQRMSHQGEKQEACEPLGIENKQKASLEIQESERQMEEAREKAEIEGQHWEACEREETERKITEALEWAETQKKQNNVCEAEESERQTKAAHEQAENEKNQKAVSEREKNERRMKEACEQAEIEKRLKFAVEETEKHLKQSLEQTEMEKNKKPASDESQKHLNESCAQEEIEMREKNFRLEDEKRFREAREREEKEKCFKEVLVKKEKLLNGPPGSDRNEKISVGALEKEEIEMSEKEVKENGQNIREAYESNGVDKRSKRVYLHEGSYLKVKAANETGGRKKEMENVVEQEEMREKSKQAFKRNESEKLTVQGEGHAELQKACVVKSTHETKSESSLAQEVYVDVGAERVKPSEEVSKVDLRKEVSAQTASKGEETDKFSSDKKKIETETELNGGRKVADPFKMEKGVAANVFLSPATAQPDSKNQEFHIIKENVNNSYYAETRIKSGAAAVGASNKLSVSEMASEREDVEGPATNTKSEVSHLGKRGKILEQPQMSSDQEMNDMIGNPPKMVNRDVEKEREFLSSQTSEGNGEGQKEAPAVKSNPYSERGNQNVNGEIKSEERQQEERLKKESELEKERQRKMEEEREREREREKDRMAVERATYEFRERAYVDARERAERAAIERATAEARQRALAEARERLERACAEAREKTFTDKQSMDARIRVERAAVERATTEARERAFEKTMSGNFFPDSSNRASSNAKNSEIVEGESAQRCKARLERHQRTAERAAKALAEKNKRDLLAQREQAEKNRLAESLGADVKRWSSGKEGNLRALLSTLQYILGPDSGWQPIPLTDVITSAAVKKAYRKATLCVHPDKLQQRGASIQQKYICEKVFDLLKEAWNKFNSEER